MVQIFLFALVGFSSALVNMGIYNLVLWALQKLGWLAGYDYLVALFFGWAFFLFYFIRYIIYKIRFR